MIKSEYTTPRKIAENRCPICDRLIPECHYRAKIKVIGVKKASKNKT